MNDIKILMEEIFKKINFPYSLCYHLQNSL